jgi:transcriptional regulator of arginine metabolism
MYRRNTQQYSVNDLLTHSGFVSIDFSTKVAIIKTRPGYAGSLAYDIDNSGFEEILGTVAGDDTVLLVIREDCSDAQIKSALAVLIPNIQ